MVRGQGREAVAASRPPAPQLCMTDVRVLKFIVLRGSAQGFLPTTTSLCASDRASKQGRRETSVADLRFSVKVDGNDETVQTQHFSENEDKDHADE